MKDDGHTQVAGEATSAMHDVLDLQQNESEGPSLKELVLTFYADQLRVYERIKAHLEHQVLHERDVASAKEFKTIAHVCQWCGRYCQVFSHQDHSYTYVQNVG